MGLGLSGLRLGLGQQLWGTVWSPANLFPTGTEEGLFLDFSDISTLYTDQTFATNISAIGDPVGGVIDKSQGGVPGPELVTNGDFASADGWMVSGGWSIADGKLTNDGTNDWQTTQNIGATEGALYLVTLTSSGRTTGQCQVAIGDPFASVRITISANGNYEKYCVAGASTAQLSFYPQSGFDGSIEVVSVKKLPGNHLKQATAAARPIWTRHPKSGVRNLLDGSDNFTGGNVTVTAVPHTISTADSVTITLSGASTAGPLVGPGELQFTPSAGTLTLSMSSAGDVQVELGSSATAYQTRVSKYNVTEAGVADCHGLTFDGVDDWLYTAANLDLSGTDATSATFGLLANDIPGAGTKVLFSHGVDANNIDGTFSAQTPGSVSVVGVHRGTNVHYTSINEPTISGPGAHFMLTTHIDISASVYGISVNGGQFSDQGVSDLGTGNMSSQVFRIGSTSAANNIDGTIYGVTLTDYILDAEQLAALETWTAARTPEVTLA